MTQNQDGTKKQATPRRKPVDRRAALKRLGLAASVAYLAPTLATIKSASAKGSKSKSKSKSKSRSKTKSKPSRS